MRNRAGGNSVVARVADAIYFVPIDYANNVGFGLIGRIKEKFMRIRARARKRVIMDV